jgi:hypothetical protein
MGHRFIQFIFFANYFVGILAVALSIETCYMLALSLRHPWHYLVLLLAPILYYTRAYQIPKNIHTAHNPRTNWYIRNRKFIAASQKILIIALVISLCVLFLEYGEHLHRIPRYFWPFIISLPIIGVLYYGLVPARFASLNLRNAGWTKPFAIGYVWAVFVGVLPICMALLEQPEVDLHPLLAFWLFFKNWMFCTINAIMFDIKDYEDDSNRRLKTLVVRMGLFHTIFYLIIPLMLLGAVAVAAVVWYRGFSHAAAVLHLIPFLCMLIVAYSLQTKKAILYYLIVIDGLLLLKALCGIASIYFFQH